jgi:hypothetical protein
MEDQIGCWQVTFAPSLTRSPLASEGICKPPACRYKQAGGLQIPVTSGTLATAAPLQQNHPSAFLHIRGKMKPKNTDC